MDKRRGTPAGGLQPMLCGEGTGRGRGVLGLSAVCRGLSISIREGGNCGLYVCICYHVSLMDGWMDKASVNRAGPSYGRLITCQYRGRMADGATNRYSRLLSLELGWIHRRKSGSWIGCEASTNSEDGPLSRRTHQPGQPARTHQAACRGRGR
jgi:hypothetical protein